MTPILKNLGPTESLPNLEGRTGTGTYLLTGVGDHVGQSGQSCL